MTEKWDVIVVGAGNAGFSAAQSARQGGARVLLLEKAPRAWAGGNSYFTAGAMRTGHGGLDDLLTLVEPLPADRAGRVDLGPYPAQDFLDDLVRVTRGRTDRELAELLTEESRETMTWLRELGLRFELMFHRQAYEVDGRYRFWGGLAVGVVGGGKGMIEQHLAAAERAGIEVRFDSPVTDLIVDGGAVGGVVLADGSRIEAGGTVLTSGGFEANAQMRAAYLGPGWDLALVRGTPHNTGDGLRMALAAGARPYGHWSGCHSVAWDSGARPTGDRELTNQLTRGGYPFGIVVNSEGRRFVDEGADYRNYTYAKYGAEILRQPGGVAYQIFDARSAPLLRPEEYASEGVTKVESDTLEGLAKQLGLDEGRLVETVGRFNAAIAPGGDFDPTVKDGCRTEGLTPPKSNWARALDTPPYAAFPVTCGVTFTFGGLHIDREARVLDTGGSPLPGLYAAGELVGGLFWFNYPGGSGLTAGSVFGRRAGRSAAGGSR